MDEECEQLSMIAVLSDLFVVKAMLVSPETLTESQDYKVNALILATGVWLEDSDTLFDNLEFENGWTEIVFRYLAKLYDAIDASKSA